MTGPELEAEARARLRLSAPQVSDQQFAAWLVEVARRGGVLTLTIDGAYAAYPRENAVAAEVRAAKGPP